MEIISVSYTHQWIFISLISLLVAVLAIVIGFNSHRIAANSSKLTKKLVKYIAFAYALFAIYGVFSNAYNHETIYTAFVKVDDIKILKQYEIQSIDIHDNDVYEIQGTFYRNDKPDFIKLLEQKGN